MDASLTKWVGAMGDYWKPAIPLPGSAFSLSTPIRASSAFVCLRGFMSFSNFSSPGRV